MPYAAIDSNKCSKVSDQGINGLLQQVRKFNYRWYVEEHMAIKKKELIVGSYSVYYWCVGADFAVLNWPPNHHEWPQNYSLTKEALILFLCGLLEGYKTVNGDTDIWID